MRVVLFLALVAGMAHAEGTNDPGPLTLQQQITRARLSDIKPGSSNWIVIRRVPPPEKTNTTNEMESAKQRMIARIPDLLHLRDRKVVTENQDGFLSASAEISDSDAKIMEAENTDRLTVFTYIAAKNGTDVAKVGQAWGAETKNRGDLEVIGTKLVRGEFGIAYVTGIVRNNTSRRLEYVRVSANFYANDNTVLGSGLDIVGGLGPGERWLFRIPVTAKGVDSYRVNAPEGW